MQKLQDMLVKFERLSATRTSCPALHVYLHMFSYVTFFNFLILPVPLCWYFISKTEYTQFYGPTNLQKEREYLEAASYLLNNFFHSFYIS